MTQSVEVADRESIELGRRILEILLEFRELYGDFFSESAFSDRIGITRYKLSQSMKHGRPLSPAEVERIADGFGKSVERVRGTDIRKHLEELKRLVSNRGNMKRAVEVAEELVLVAIGYSERFEILNNLGAAFYYMGTYEEAEKVWLQALEIAKKIEKHFGEREPLYKASTNVLLVYEKLNKFDTLRMLLDNASESLDQFLPRYAGTLCYALGKAAQSVRDMNDYRRKTYDSLHYFRMTDDKIDIGLAENRVAIAEFKMGNYSEVLSYAGKSMESLVDQKDEKHFPAKNYAKALLKLGEVKAAVELIEKSIRELRELNSPKLLAKFLLLHTIATNDIQSAEQVLQFEDEDGTLHLLACQSLMSHYSKVNDPINLMKYYRIAEKVKQTSANWEVV